MPKPISVVAAVAALCLLAGEAAASELNVRVTDPGGAAVASAVVSLTPVKGASAGVPALAVSAVVNQDHETFWPLVTVLPIGGSVTFRNSDRTMHQVYSFSPLRQFEFEVQGGEISPAVVFDKLGVVAIGCNIHDQMITYVVVTDNPLTQLSDEHGAVRFADLAPGRYQARVWQPDLTPGTTPPVSEVDVGAAAQQLVVPVRIMRRHMAPMGHMGSY